MVTSTLITRQSRGWFLALALLVPLPCGAGQYVEIRADIEVIDWDGWFFFDQLGKWPGQDSPPSVFSTCQTRRCVVGADTWMLESVSAYGKVTRWFTGTNIVEHTLITKATPDDVLRRISLPGMPAATAPPVGRQFTTVHASLDGNPARPVRVADLMGFDLPATVCWLAFCSGPCLKRDGRQLFPPSAFWKESRLVYWGWKDHTEVFPDSLGLPRSINLITTNNQCVFQYQVRQHTNVLGWTFPLEFYGVQYHPTGTNAWKLHLTLKGKVTAIGPGAAPQIPAEVLRAVEQ